MIKNLEKNKKLWLIVASLSLVAAVIGVFNQDIYSKVISDEVLPGVISQDIITIIISSILLFFSLKLKDINIKEQIISLSFIAYLIYGYGIYVIEQIYSPLYILYVAIVALSFWSLVYSLINIREEISENIKLPKFIKYMTIGFLIFIPALFYTLWIGELIPLMKSGEKLEFMFSIYIMDMVFVLPAFLISAYMIIKEEFLGYIFAPLLFFKAFTLLFSVGLGGLLKPLYNQISVQGENMFYIILSIIFLALAVLNYWNLDFKNLKSIQEKFKG